MNVLLIHREERLRAILETALAGKGFCFFETNDSRRAAFKLSLLRFQAIILDEALPETEGCSFLKRLADDFPEIPVVFLVENPGGQVAKMAMDLGAFSVLPKPLHPFNLMQILAAANLKNQNCCCNSVSDDSAMPFVSKNARPKFVRQTGFSSSAASL